jgi:hypothetical protein
MSRVKLPVGLSPAVHKELGRTAADDQMCMAAWARKAAEEYVGKRAKGGGK